MIELRTPIQEDLYQLAEWQHDTDIQALSPVIGPVDGPLFWSIYNDGILIGAVSLYNRSGQSIEMGIFIGDSANWSRGYGSEAIQQLLAMCSEAGFTEVHLKVLPDNMRAIRCYEKCGFTQVGQIFVENREFVFMSIEV
jgi:RimJ/RimL family protein N-acetyltransferase